MTRNAVAQPFELHSRWRLCADDGWVALLWWSVTLGMMMLRKKPGGHPIIPAHHAVRTGPLKSNVNY